VDLPVTPAEIEHYDWQYSDESANRSPLIIELSNGSAIVDKFYSKIH